VRKREVVAPGPLQVESISQGRGPLVVLLASAGRGADDFDEVAALIAGQGFRVLRPEPRGSGATAGPHAGISLHDAAADVAAVIAHERSGAAILVGHAAGSFVARTAAVDYPGLVRGVVLAAAGARSYPPIPALRKLDESGLTDAQRVQYLREAYFAPGNDASVWLAGWRPRIQYGGINGSPDLAGRDQWWGAGLKPVLEIQALDDPFKPPGAQGEYRAEFGERVTVARIAQASHALFPEQPAAVAAAIVEWARMLPAAAEPMAVRPAAFQECAQCPPMVAVPPGSFVMGSPLGEATRGDSEGPQHEVSFIRPIAIARTAITRGQFAPFARETGILPSPKCDWSAPGFAQNDSHPVVCVSWDDAVRYAKWLSGKAGKSYRLLSEAEYEYAARAGASTAYPWGAFSADACAFANAGDAARRLRHPALKDPVACSDGFAETAPAGSFAPNAFGLQDMTANTWSWTQDCWHPSYEDAPANGTARAEDGCAFRVARGGSWNFGARAARAAMRGKLAPTVRGPDQGFRVARDL
jgi:formylglycine-generating enzyme required for sulfatase activity